MQTIGYHSVGPVGQHKKALQTRDSTLLTNTTRKGQQTLTHHESKKFQSTNSTTYEMPLPESPGVHTFSNRHSAEVVPEGLGFAKYDTKHEKQPGFGSSESSAAGGPIENLLDDDPFSSEASRILFNGIDEIRRCDVAVDLDLPQLVIVGQQSAGKSSLLRSLTDIPFPVGGGLCTRFVTRIISRRSPPGTSDTVRITIEQEDSSIPVGPGKAQREPFVEQVSAITATTFKDYFDKASDYMGITNRTGARKSALSSDVLRIELHGSSRAHFGILDVPGIFHATIDGVTTREDLQKVRSLVISYMKKPGNVIICVAPAIEDLANHAIFELAREHAESSRVVGVITKCDIAPNPKEVVSVVRDNKGITLHNGWFVVQNLTEDAYQTANLQEKERELFTRDPWLEIPVRQRGTAELKRFLASTLSSRIRKAFPDLQRRIKDLLAAEKVYLAGLGHERDTPERKRAYLLQIVGRYQELARDALNAPARLPSDDMKLLGLTRRAEHKFAETMEKEGHFFPFLVKGGETDVAKLAVSNSEVANHDVPNPQLYKEIRYQINVNRGEELPGMINPAVLKPLVVKQTSKWEGIGETYLKEAVKISEDVVSQILRFVSAEFAIADHTKAELASTLANFRSSAEKRAMEKLREFCHNNETAPLTTRDDEFRRKIHEAQRARFVAALLRYRENFPPEAFYPVMTTPESNPSTEPTVQQEESPKAVTSQQDIQLLRAEQQRVQDFLRGAVVVKNDSIDQLFEQIHPRAKRNVEDEIHDFLKAYYELTRGYFENYVTREIVNKFLDDSQGPILGLSSDFVLALSDEQVEILGGEDEFVVRARFDTVKRIQQREQAMKIAGETWRRSMQVEK